MGKRRLIRGVCGDEVFDGGVAPPPRAELRQWLASDGRTCDTEVDAAIRHDWLSGVTRDQYRIEVDVRSSLKPD